MSASTLTDKELIIQARKEVLINKDLPKAFSILNGIDESKISHADNKLLFKNTLALAYLENKEYLNAAKFYKESGIIYNAGFCELLAGNEAEAQKLWNSQPESNQCRWGQCILDLIQEKKAKKPTYLQIRNNLETDLGYFIQAKKLPYAEILMKNDELFIEANLEAYKLFGKVLLNYGFFNMARKYLLKSLEKIPYDSETIYFLGRYNYLIGAYKESKSIMEQCIDYNRDYTPAHKLLEKIELKLNKI